DNGRRSGKKEEPNALVTLDGEGIDWTSHAEDGEEYFALMAFNNASSDTEVISYSTKYVESYSKLKKLYDKQREQLSDASVEIQTYAQGLKKVEAQLVTHQNNQLWYEQKIRYMKIDLDDKTDVLTYHKKLLAEALKEKEDLNTKFKNWQNSSKNLGKLLNTQMSASDKFGLGYGDHRFDGILSYENEVLQSVFINKDDNADDRTLNDRFATTNGMHAVPPPMTGNYMPSEPDIEIDESQFTYGPKQPQSSEPDTRSSDFDSCESTLSIETLDCMPVPIVIDPKAVSTPKVWTDAPIIEEYESDSDDECVSTPSSEQEQPRETVQKHKTCSQSPKVNKKDLNGSKSTRMSLGYGGTRKGCYVCGSFSHLIRDCDFHEKRMAKQAAMNKNMLKSSNKKDNKPKWNNVQKVNHLNQFVPSAVLTRSSKILINTARASGTNHVNTARQNVSSARQRSSSQVVPSRTARKVSTESTKDDPQRALKNKGIVDSGCSRHMTGNKGYLVDYQDYNRGPVAFRGKNSAPSEGLTCLIAKATTDESNKWHRRLGHVNFKNLNKLVKGNLVRGLPSKIFQNDHTCVACQKGKQHKASCKAKVVSSISQPLQLLHMDLFGPTSVRSLNHKTYCLVITDDFSRVLVTKPHNKTPYELITGKQPIISYIRPFGCHVTILNTLDHLGKFEEKADEGFLVGYSLTSKAFRVYNLETKRVEENLHVKFLENKTNVAGKGPTWLFDLDYLTDSMNYQPVPAENRANKTAGPKEANHRCWFKKNEEPEEQVDQVFLEELKRLKRQEKDANDAAEALRKEFARSTEDLLLQAGAAKANSTNQVSTDRPSVSTDSLSVSTDSPRVSTDAPHPDQDDSQIPTLEDMYDSPNSRIFTKASYDDEGAVADFINLESIVNVSPIPTSRIHTIHPITQILGDPTLAVQPRCKVSKSFGSHTFVSYIQKQRRNNYKDFQHCLFACFLSQVEPKKISDALEDES
ncbi:ribonuclease H-like domain-containing protein, partial [Tanacetum coccineum]